MTGYIYDADGNRVAKGSITTLSCNLSSNGFQLTESYVLGPSGEQLTTLDGSSHWQRTNVYGAGKLFATYDSLGLHFQLTDPLGTRRIQTSAVGQPELDCQSLPYGNRPYCFDDPNAPATADDATPLHYTGKERDTESGNDYFGARYYASTMGRLLSPDPETPTPLHLLNPQRWNMYSYGLSNPLLFTDSGGRDAAAVNFSHEIAIVGHEGIMSVTSDGTVRYARFGPVGGSRATGEGLVQSFTLQTKIQFDSNGNPTSASLNAVKQELSAAGPEKGQNPSSIRLNYFKTTDQETANLNQWIDQQQAASDQGKSPKYNVLTNNCTMFCQRGLVAGGAMSQSDANKSSIVPNMFWDWTNFTQSQEPKATVTTTECDTLPDGSQRCSQ